VKLVGFVASDPSLTGQPAVVKGPASSGGPVRGWRGARAQSRRVGALPLGAPVEIELVAEVG
jgi:hypothetical protein